MKINGRPSTPSKGVSIPLTGITPRGNTVKGSPGVGSGHPSEDHIEISSEAGEFMSIKAIIASVPDIREDLVSTLKRAIEKGTYHAPPELVAEKIIQESLMNAHMMTLA